MRTLPENHTDTAIDYPSADPETPVVPMLLCPNGHLNAWNYQFCGECGALLGTTSAANVAPQATQTLSTPTTRWFGSSSVRWLAIGGAVLLVAAMTAAATYFFTRDTRGVPTTAPTTQPHTGAPPLAQTPCASPPLLQAEAVDIVPAGLAITTTIASSCGTADLISNSAMQINVVDGAHDVAAATFDMSAHPVALPPGQQATQTLIFPAGMYWLTPNLLTQRPTMSARYNGRATQDAVTEATPAPASVTATQPASPQFGSAESAALIGLHGLLDADRPVVAGLQHWWLPQVSSKRPGLVAEGITWTNADVLRDHLALRQRFLQARLVWSSDWTTFSSPNWWVTIVALPMTTPHQANGWCDAQGLDADHCFAKMISSVLGPDGTTVYRN
jgi:hypothetical protein